MANEIKEDINNKIFRKILIINLGRKRRASKTLERVFAIKPAQKKQ